MVNALLSLETPYYAVAVDAETLRAVYMGTVYGLSLADAVQSLTDDLKAAYPERTLNANVYEI